MRSESKVKIIETVIIVESGDMIDLAKGSDLWLKNGTVVETWIDENEKSFKVRIQAPE